LLKGGGGRPYFRIGSYEYERNDTSGGFLAVSTVSVGSNSDYAKNWDAIFKKGKPTKKEATPSKSAPSKEKGAAKKGASAKKKTKRPARKASRKG
jgi:hypothetical protein